MNKIIPNDWKRIKLSEVLSEEKEKNKDNQVSEVLSVTNSNGFVRQEDYFEGTVHSEDISKYKVVRKNQFAYNPSRINVGSIDLLTKYEKGALSPMYTIFSVDESRVFAPYFKYYFQTYDFEYNVKNNTKGSVRESLDFKDLISFEYNLPPLNKQKEYYLILKSIDDMVIEYNNKIENYNNLIKSQFVKEDDYRLEVA